METTFEVLQALFKNEVISINDLYNVNFDSTDIYLQGDMNKEVLSKLVNMKNQKEVEVAENGYVFVNFYYLFKKVHVTLT